MDRKSKIITAAVVVAVLGVSGYAASSYAHEKHHKEYGGHDRSWGKSDRHHRGHKFAKRMFGTYDTNGDGALTMDEVMTTRAADFKNFDKNGDGVLEVSEYKELWMDAMFERMVDRFQRYDNDGDGRISEEDYSERMRRMMTWMDRNEDGKVDREDRGRRGHDKD